MAVIATTAPPPSPTSRPQVKAACPEEVRSGVFGHDPYRTFRDSIAFARALYQAGQWAKVTTDGRLDETRLRRACNYLLGRVASDRPIPTKDDWEAAERRVTGGAEDAAAQDSNPFAESGWQAAFPDDPTPPSSFPKKVEGGH